MKRGVIIELDEKIKACLPAQITTISSKYESIEEIRLRTDCPLCFTVKGRNLVTNYTVTKSDIVYCVSGFCKNSLYSFTDQIKNGYIPVEGGYRIGICGTAVTENGQIKNISDINSLNIRIPISEIYVPSSILHEPPYAKGIMIYSPPNGGKTTLLKHVAAYLAKPPVNKRVAVLDPKKELFSELLHKNLPMDFFVGYPKYKAMDMAVRNMSPEVLICDEIGIEDDTSVFEECKNCGVNIVCSAHASSLHELLSRRNIRPLHSNGVFEGYIGITAVGGTRRYNYTSRKDIRV